MVGSTWGLPLEPIAETTPPEYIRYAHGIQEPPASKAGEFLGKIGSTIEEGVKTADARNITHIQQEGASKGENIMDEEIAKYEPTYRALQGIPDDKAVDKGEVKASLVDSMNKGTLPEPAENILKNAKDAVGMANKANNTFDLTYAMARVYNASKTARSLYPTPAYKDAYDKGLKQATGFDGANDYYKGIITNINSYITKAQQEKNKEETHALTWMDSGLIQKEDFADWRAGKITFDQLAMKMGDKANARHAVTDANAKLNNNDLTDKEKGRRAQEAFGTVIQSTANHFLTDFSAVAGFKSTNDLIDTLHDLQSRKSSPENAEEVTKLLGAFHSTIVRMRDKMTRDIQESYSYKDPTTGESTTSAIAKHISPEEAKKMVDAKMSNIEEMYKAFSEGKFSVAEQIAKSISDVQQNVKRNIFDDKLGKLGSMVHEMNQLDPVMGQRTREIIDASQADTLYKPQLEYLMRKMGITPPEKVNAPSVIDAIETLRDKGAKDADVHEAILRHVESIADATNPTMIRNMAYSAFNPKNMAVISKFRPEEIQQNADGTITQKSGRVDVYNRMFAPDIIAKVKSLNDPKLNAYVEQYAQNAFGFTIMRNIVDDMRNATLERGDKIIWDENKHQFSLLPSIAGAPGPIIAARRALDQSTNAFRQRFAPTTGDLRESFTRTLESQANTRASFAIGNLNRSIQTLENVYKLNENYKPENTTAYIFDALKHNGLDYGEKTGGSYMSPPAGLPEAVMNAITATRVHQKRQEEVEKAAREKSKEMGK